jgi:uncharacterized protein GlcG (DUF336 family)
MIGKFKAVACAAVVSVASLLAHEASADPLSCPTSWSNLRSKLQAAVTPGGTYWAVVVNRSGVVCSVAFSGPHLLSQWLLSRQIAAAKAFTSNGLSNSPSQTFTTAQLYAAVQPGGSLFGLAAGNPGDPAKLYKGPQHKWGTAQDPMVGEIVGGTITFGGGTVIIRGNAIRGAVGVSGDSAANDQIVSDKVASTL